ncbi:MAG: Benzoylformate decarboxylase [Alphaproteobacteria bacterium MarineAlpha4_Bin2]|nr:MAG: Benzoylformate decarboxylase [Alphaproteobacteria bacterium MarineAlpha4_Bin2]
MAANQITGRSAFLALLKAQGVTHLFGNPGTTELPIMHALKDHPDLTYVMGMQESVVVAMADGYSRATGELVACNVHVAPGLGNAMGSLYNCKFTGTPLIITAGQQELGHGLTEPLLYDSLVPMAEPLVKWATEITRLEDMPRIVHRAAKIAMTPPTGPVFLSLPGDILNNEAGIDLGGATRVDTRNRPSEEALEEIAERLLRAENPVMICGNEIVSSNALTEAANFASALGATVYQQTVPYGAHFLSEHPCFVGGLSRSQKEVREVLEPFDLMIVVGADVLRMSVWDEVDPMPDNLPIVQIGLNDWEMGKNYTTELAIGSDVRETLRALIPVLKEKGGAALADATEKRIAVIAGKNWSTKRAKLIEKISSEGSGTPINPDWLMLQITEALPDNAIVINEGVTATRYLNDLRPYRDRYDYHGLASGGIGWGIAASVGVQLAHPDRPVCAIIGDGSSMYSIQALWSAANQKLPMTYVIVNNGGYRIIKQRLLSFHKNDHFIGMDFKDPEVNFAALAQSMGVEAQRVEDPLELRGAIESSLNNRNGPNLVEVICDGSV